MKAASKAVALPRPKKLTLNRATAAEIRAALHIGVTEERRARAAVSRVGAGRSSAARKSGVQGTAAVKRLPGKAKSKSSANTK